MKQEKSNFRFLIVSGILFLLTIFSASARGLRIPMGNREVLVKVYDLPDTEEYQTDDGTFIDLGRFHREFNIAYILPLSIETKPILVGYAKNGVYYDLTDEYLEAILQENNLDEKKLLDLGFYTRYGGKIVAGLIIVFILWGFIPGGKKKKVDPVRV